MYSFYLTLLKSNLLFSYTRTLLLFLCVIAFLAPTAPFFKKTGTLFTPQDTAKSIITQYTIWDMGDINVYRIVYIYFIHTRQCKDVCVLGYRRSSYILRKVLRKLFKCKDG